MAFRKTSYAKVFVEDELPSFLVPREDSAAPPAIHQGSMNVSPALLNRPAMPAAQPSDKPQPHERRNKALQLRPVFMLRVVVVAVLLNVLLYLLFNELPIALRASSDAVFSGASIEAL